MASFYGGAIDFNNRNYEITFDDCVFRGNSAIYGFGALAFVTSNHNNKLTNTVELRVSVVALMFM